MLLYAIVAVFIAGLMVGRTPEYVGKKIEQKEVKMAMLALIATAFSILVFDSSAPFRFAIDGKPSRWPAGAGNCEQQSDRTASAKSCTRTPAATGNNGSAFAGISANTPWYNLTLGLAMLIGRFLFLIPLLAAAGSLARKKKYQSPAAHSRPTDRYSSACWSAP